MRRYETIYILRPNLGEDEITKVVESTNAILSSDDGEIIALDQWGLRKLAYLIKKESNGYYVYCDYATAPDNVSEMERKFRIDDTVMKYMTVKLADAIDADGIEAARGDYEAAKVAAAQAAEEAEQDKEEQSDNKKEPVKEAVKEAVKEPVQEAASETEEVKETSGE